MRVLLDYETDNGRRGFGDVLISTPVIEALAKKYGTRIDVVLRKEAQPLLYDNPYVRRIYELTDQLPIADIHLVLGMKVEDYSNPRNQQPRVDSMAELFGVSCNNKVPQLYYPEQQTIPNSIGVSIESESDVRTWQYNHLLKLIEEVKAEWHVFGLKAHDLLPNVQNHLGKLTLEETIKWTARMERFLTVDSFFSHLTASLNIPTVILYTSIPAEWRSKYYPKAKAIQAIVECSPCWDKQKNIKACNGKCTYSITPQLVEEYLK
ncbi:glycosyltransferase family 9 protein [bacterium]|nr:glycosyltransferase family 9 protein [bacterium]